MRTASAANEFGGSIAVRLNSWKTWFGTMSRKAPVDLVEIGAALDADGFGDRDLHVIDMVAVPQRLEDAVGKAQRHDVLDRLLAEEMVHAEDLRLVQYLEDAGVERLGRWQDRGRTAFR